MQPPASRQSFLQRRLQYLLLLRLLALGAQLLALVLMVWLFELSLPWLPVTVTIGLLLGITAVTGYQAQRSAVSGDGAIFAQLLIDIAALSALVYFTGGSVNPFIALFLLPITFAAAALRPRFVWPVALLAIAAYTLLMFYHRPVMPGMHDHGPGFALHLWGMWYGFIVSAVLLVYFVGRLGRALHDRDRRLATAREEALRADQVIAMGALATGTAHELGTPLATMAVLVRDMEDEAADEPAMRDNLECLREQIDRCKQVLGRLASDTGQNRADSGRSLPVDDYLQAIAADWRALREGIRLDLEWRDNDGPAPVIVADRTLSQALMNVLNNAADADADHITLRADWADEQALHIRVIDNGSGLDPAVHERAGVAPYSGKPAGEGLGLGLFLARTTLQRFGGSLQIDDHADGGTRVDIMLPLASLRTTT